MSSRSGARARARGGAHQDLRVNHRQGHGRVEAGVLDHVLHGDGAARHLLLHLEDLLLLRLQLHGGRLCAKACGEGGQAISTALKATPGAERAQCAQCEAIWCAEPVRRTSRSGARITRVGSGQAVCREGAMNGAQGGNSVGVVGLAPFSSAISVGFSAALGACGVRTAGGGARQGHLTPARRRSSRARAV